MPNAIRGGVYDYDYGDIVGNELSARRRALIISTDDWNAKLHVAMSLPTSENPPPDLYINNYVEVANAGSWASVRQIKSIDQQELGRYRGRATHEELERTLETITARLASTQSRPGTVNTESGPRQIAKGTVWYLQFKEADPDSDDRQLEFPIVVLDFNYGNNMAVVAQIDFGHRPESPGKVPITVVDANQNKLPASALVYRIRSIDTSARPMTKIGGVQEHDQNAINWGLLEMIAAN